MVHESNWKFLSSQLYIIYMFIQLPVIAKDHLTTIAQTSIKKFDNHRFSIYSVLINNKLETLMSMHKSSTSRFLLTVPGFISCDGCICVHDFFLIWCQVTISTIPSSRQFIQLPSYFYFILFFQKSKRRTSRNLWRNIIERVRLSFQSIRSHFTRQLELL